MTEDAQKSLSQLTRSLNERFSKLESMILHAQHVATEGAIWGHPCRNRGSDQLLQHLARIEWPNLAASGSSMPTFDVQSSVPASPVSWADRSEASCSLYGDQSEFPDPIIREIDCPRVTARTITNAYVRCAKKHISKDRPSQEITRLTNNRKKTTK